MGWMVCSGFIRRGDGARGGEGCRVPLQTSFSLSPRTTPTVEVIIMRFMLVTLRAKSRIPIVLWTAGLIVCSSSRFSVY